LVVLGAVATGQVGLAFPAKAIPPSNWPQSGYGAAHVSYNPIEDRLSTANVAHLHRLFDANVGLTLGGPSVVGSNVYTVNAELVDSNSVTGRVVWRDRAGPNNGADSPPAADGGHVFVTWNNGLLTSDNGVTGARNWSTRLDRSAIVASTPAVRDGVVYATTVDLSGSGGLWAVDESSGHLIWGDRGQFRILPPPAVTRSLVVAPTQSGVSGFDPATGKRRWTSSGTVQGMAAATPAVYTISGCEVEALRPSDGSALWTTSLPHGCGSVSFGPAIAYGRVYIGSNGHQVFALDQTDGSLDWTAPGPGGGAVPSVANGVVYVGFVSLEAIRASNGAVLTEVKQRSDILSQPAVAQGRVYVLAGSTLEAYGP
jgi:outer membrane protein assembly factor BamB